MALTAPAFQPTNLEKLFQNLQKQSKELALGQWLVLVPNNFPDLEQVMKILLPNNSFIYSSTAPQGDGTYQCIDLQRKDRRKCKLAASLSEQKIHIAEGKIQPISTLTTNTIMFLTRPGLFPLQSVNKTVIPMYKVALTSEGNRISTPTSIVGKIYDHIRTGPWQIDEHSVTFVDFNAGVGCDSLNFLYQSSQSSLKFSMVCLESNALNYQSLKTNLSLYEYTDKQVQSELLDALKPDFKPKSATIFYLNGGQSKINQNSPIWSFVDRVLKDLKHYSSLKLIIIKGSESIGEKKTPNIWLEGQGVLDYQIPGFIFVNVSKFRLGPVEVVKTTGLTVDDLLQPKRLIALFKCKSMPNELGQNVSRSTDLSIIEKELLRQTIYQDILTEVQSMPFVSDKQMTNKQKANLVLSYLFANIIGSPDQSSPEYEPVFTENYPQGLEQLRDDFNYFGIKQPSTDEFMNFLIGRFGKARDMMKNTSVPLDAPVKVENNIIFYKNKSWNDIRGIATRYPELANYALALNIRYNYIQLGTHGLSRNYKAEGFKPSDPILEAFASVFNHYFDKFCSAFPDLESPYGSLGSYFHLKTIPTTTIFANPPFQLTVIRALLSNVKYRLQDAKEHLEYTLTLPKWTDCKDIMDFQNFEYTKRFTIIPKEKAEFVDYSGISPEIVHPCGIIEIQT